MLSAWLNACILEEGFNPGHLSVIICSDNFLLEVNRKFLDHDYYTDIITFPQENPKGISGDLFISVDRIAENCKRLKVRFIDELHRVMIHGILHLCGYTDKLPKEEKKMRQREDYYLQLRNDKLLQDVKLQ